MGFEGSFDFERPNESEVFKEYVSPGVMAKSLTPGNGGDGTDPTDPGKIGEVEEEIVLSTEGSDL